MRPGSIKLFEACYLAGAALVALDAMLQWDALLAQSLAELSHNNAEQSGIDPATLLGASIAFVVGVMVVLWFLAARLRIGFVRWIMLGTAAWQLVGLARVGVPVDTTPALAYAALVLQLAGLAFAFSPSARRWYVLADGDADDGPAF